jgi:hypothetical protein
VSRRAAVRLLLGVVLAAMLLIVGIAIGEALHDNPKPGLTVTTTLTLHP